MSNSALTCDSSGGVFAEFSGPISKTWDTGIRVQVSPDQFCWFLPTNSSKFRQVVLRCLPDQQPQPLILFSKKPQCWVKKGKLLGTLHFLKGLELEKSIKLVWE
jgi:hypothetical protein